MAGDFSRRNLITRGIPAAALMSFGMASALGQDGSKEHAHHPALFAALEAGFKDGKYVLPTLPYGYDALEPHIDAQTMELHHSKHHLSYVNGLNKTLEALKSDKIDPDTLFALERNLSFHGGGHLMHLLFWATMAPNAGGEPGDHLAEGIKNDFGSFEAFKERFSAVAGGVKGSGWALLGYDSVGRRLIVYGLNEHDQNVMPGILPLLPLDVWEHAYYLKHQNKRADYVKAWWNVVNWAPVNELYAFMHQKP